MKIPQLQATFSETPEHPFLANPNLSREEILIQAAEYLRVAVATAYESADNLRGSQRDHAQAVVRLVEMSKVLVDAAL
jgi:hypothetical protein